MAAIIDVEELKAQLNVTSLIDDVLLGRLADAAQAHVERVLGFSIEDPPTGDDAPWEGDPPEDLRHAVLLLAAHWYENREGSIVGVIAQPIPMGVADVLANYRSYTFG